MVAGALQLKLKRPIWPDLISAAGQAAQLGRDLGLAEAGGQRQWLPPAHGLGDLGEELVDAGGPDGRQHLAHVTGAVGDVPGGSHGAQASSRNFL